MNNFFKMRETVACGVLRVVACRGGGTTHATRVEESMKIVWWWVKAARWSTDYISSIYGTNWREKAMKIRGFANGNCNRQKEREQPKGWSTQNKNNIFEPVNIIHKIYYTGWYFSKQSALLSGIILILWTRSSVGWVGLLNEFELQ